MHRASADDGDERREMHRILLKGPAMEPAGAP
jgi:hypothetical protein